MPKSLALALMKSMAPMVSMASMELRACLSPAPRGPPDRYHRKKRFLLTSVPPPASLTEMTCTERWRGRWVPKGTHNKAQARRRSSQRAGRLNRATKSAQSSNLPSPTYVVSCPGPRKMAPHCRFGAQDAARRQPHSVNVRSGRRACCNRAQPARQHGKMALLPLEKAPFSAIFRHFFVDFPRVFSTSFFGMALWARIRPQNALLLNWPRSNPLGKPA